jgi:two-component system sensor histidine kinase ResE
MSWLWRSVVGKLWMTIIVLVTVVLFILTMLLVNFFDRFYYDQQEEALETLTNKVATIFETYHDKEVAVQTAKELIEVSKTRLTVIIGPNEGDLRQVSADKEEVPQISVDTFLNEEEFQDVFYGKKIIRRDHYPVKYRDQEITETDMIIVGVPLILDGRQSGAVFLYQTLDAINHTVMAAKKLIMYAAGIGIVLTTVFAFFLSSRITYPLRQMKVAADNMAEGDFHSRVSIRSTDEIGDLALTFNHMAEHLNDLIHALSQEKEQLSNILRSMVDGVITLDVNGKVILINPPAERMLNTWKYEENVYSDTEVIPRLFLNIFEQVLNTGKEHESHVSAQGRFWTIAMAPLYNRDVIRGAVAVIRDMTEEERLDKLRKDFVANVSHELRTPLSMMQGYSEALIDDIVGNPEERKELAQIIHDESLRMGRLVNELLDLARMEAGHIELNRECVDMEQIVHKVSRKFVNLAKEQRIDIIDDIEHIEHDYSIDPDRMEQILTNLIDNAIRHTPEEGKVTIVLKEEKECLLLSVNDTGSGIPEEDLPFVFERFYKADKARTRGRSGSGTGIGLSIVKHLVEAHGGQIQVHSKVGEGTTFSIQLPDS